MTTDPWATMTAPPLDDAVPLEERAAGTQDSPPMSVPSPADLYADIAAILEGGDIDTPTPEHGICSDGIGLFYAGQVNIVMGDPESGKTLLVQAAAVQALKAGQRVAMIDCDHNGAGATVARLVDLGAPETALRDRDRFRYVDPDDGDHVAAVVRDLMAWRAHLVIVDSIGELLPMYGANSNSADDYTTVNRATLVPLARSGASVVGIDHLAKNTESRQMGATGTAAKKRTVGGTALRVTLAEAFAPGKGGAAHVAIVKDRHGGLRSNRPTGDREPLAATFRVHAASSLKRFTLKAPEDGTHNPAETAPASDLAQILALDPPPANVEDARRRLKWAKARTLVAMRAWRAGHGDGTPGLTQGVSPESRPEDSGLGPAAVLSPTCHACELPMAFDDGTGTHATCEVTS